MSKQENKSGHNSNARKNTIQEACRDITALEAERKAVSDKITALKQKTIKADLGMKVSDFNIALRLYKLEGEDRDELLRTVRETFEALGVGEQLDWLEADERATNRTTEKDDSAGEKGAAGAGSVPAAA